MKTKIIQPPAALLPYVSSMMVLESDAGETETHIPFYADGCPGIMFSQSANGVCLQPQNQMLDAFILYGQTVHPIELCMQGHFRLVVFCLYPYVTQPLFGINLEDITDGCFNLAEKAKPILAALQKTTSADTQVNIISQYLQALIQLRQPDTNTAVSKAIKNIIASKGVLSIKTLRESLHMTERTFERHFAAQVGISPKLFTQIIKFQVSLGQLTAQDQRQLSDIVYENGFADQSHFIRTFKKFAGKTPKGFRKTAGQ